MRRRVAVQARLTTVTEPRDAASAKKPARTVPASPKVRPPARAAAPPVRAAAPPVRAAAPQPAHRHPNLGLAPANMTAAFPQVAQALRTQKLNVAAHALEAAIAADPTIQARHGEVALRQLLRDAETLIERLAMDMGSGDPRWLAEYAEWVGPIYRRRGIPQADVATLCEGLRSVARLSLEPDASAQMDRCLDAAIAVFKKNGRLAGDQHKRNSLLRWLYRGV